MPIKGNSKLIWQDLHSKGDNNNITFPNNLSYSEDESNVILVLVLWNIA